MPWTFVVLNHLKRGPVNLSGRFSQISYNNGRRWLRFLGRPFNKYKNLWLWSIRYSSLVQSMWFSYSEKPTIRSENKRYFSLKDQGLRREKESWENELVESLSNVMFNVILNLSHNEGLEHNYREFLGWGS